MRAWALTRNESPLENIEMDDPQPSGTEVVIEVSACGICHSDLHIWKGWYDLGGGNILNLLDRGIQLPRALGHEIIGRVVAFGPDATAVQHGDLRIVYPWIGCGKCDICKEGRENLCDNLQSLGVMQNGGFAEKVVVPHSRYLIDPGQIDPAWAATLACSGLTVYSAIKKILPLSPDRPILLIGCGGLGLAAISMLQAFGHRNIVAADVDDAKIEAALTAGARTAVNTATDNPVAAVIAKAGSQMAAAIDFVNNAATARLGFESLAKAGKLVLVGVGGGEMMLSLPGMIFRARTIQGSTTGTLAELNEVVEMARSGKLQPTPVTHVPKDDVNAAMDRLKSGQVVGRIVLE